MSVKAIKLIKKLRKDLGLSTPQLSEQLGFKSKSTIWLIESGRREPSLLICRRLIKLARENGIQSLTIDKLMEDDNDAGSNRLK